MPHTQSITGVLTFSFIVTIGCGLFESGLSDSKTRIDIGVGGECQKDSDCRSNFTCSSDSTCQPCNCVKIGAPCDLSAECQEGLYCNNQRECAKAGLASEGESCQSTSACEIGLTCSVDGFALVCSETGTKDIGASCESTLDCLAGLNCVLESNGSKEDENTEVTHICKSVVSLYDIDYPSMGLDLNQCPDDEDQPIAYFKIPQNQEKPKDFYRLPFPNNIRLSDEGIDLSDHPVPSSPLFSPIERYLKAAEDLRGFATNPVIIFRFSKYPTNITDENIKIVDITPDSPTYNRGHSRYWKDSSGKTTYLCNNWLALAPKVGEPLRPNTTYAAYITTSIKTEDGESFDRSSDLNTLLDDTAPSDPELLKAHQKYAPFREWLDESGIDSDDILNATVFTTQDPEEPIQKLRDAVYRSDKPTISSLTICEEGVTSPCQNADDTRDCGPVNDDFIELHGLISIPIFQQGVPPYENPEDGGQIFIDDSEVPSVVDTEKVCFALTIPTQEAGESGYPLLIFGHGTGGGFNSLVRDGLASEIAKGEVDGTSILGATMTIDLPQHGTRLKGSDRTTEELFFNYSNPKAARGNVQQGAADLMSIIRWAVDVELSADSTPIDRPIKFDRSRIALFGHSQGAIHAALLFPYEPNIAGVVLSGLGGHLSSSLLTKTSPINIAAVLPFALSDVDSNGKLRGGALHPILAIIQTYFERVDPINFAYRIHREPWSIDDTPIMHHLFMTYGKNDTYSPEETQKAYAKAGRLTVVNPVLESLDTSTSESPLIDNIEKNDSFYTIGLHQYQPSAGEDGHFVSLEKDAGRSEVVHFLLQVLLGQSPQIGK